MGNIIACPDLNKNYMKCNSQPYNRAKGSALYIGIAFLLSAGFCKGQELVYDDFEGNKAIHYAEKFGVLDSTAKNPKQDEVNKSEKCGKYIRNGTKKFDNIKMKLPANLVDVSPYATHYGIPPKLKMKVYTSAPVGTLVEILLGNKNRNNEYPAGTNSQYQAHTTKTNQWEELTFTFSQIPEGSQTATTEVDQVTLLFNPNSSTSDVYYFDEIKGPGFVNVTKAPDQEEKKGEKAENTKKLNIKKKNKK
jgi:hypothetical protein